MTVTEQELVDQLAYAESEGPSDLFTEDPLEGADYADLESDEVESEFGESESDEGYFEMGEAEDDLFTTESEEEAALGNGLSAILGAEDEDEFFGKIASFVKKKGLPFLGKIARAAGPALSLIPHPAAQMAGRVAGMLGKLRAEGATIEDALEAVAEVAVRDRRALPVVAGLAARTVVKNKGAQMSPTQRRQAIRSSTNAAKTLVAAGGPKAIRALPKVAKSVRRTAVAKGTPAAVRPQVLQRTAAKVAQNPMLLQRLSQPSPRAQAIVRQTAGSMRTFSVPGPARITISVT